MKRKLVSTLLTASLVTLGLSVTSVDAQVVYAPPPSPLNGLFPRTDESYDTHPSYQIGATADGRATVAVIHRCAYLGGWNAGDFVREENGIPLGVGHTCPQDQPRARIRAAY